MESPGPWKSPGKLFRPEVLLGDKVSSHLSSMHLTCVLDGLGHQTMDLGTRF